jgi:UDP-N-acetylmuramoyl-tripeptide--D-alanyl-D-alanine ligase
MMNIEQLYSLYTQHPAICTDSRRVTDGCIYLALKGDNFDGNDFAASALNQGAAYAIVDRVDIADDPRMILVEDGLSTLQQLARKHRDEFAIPFIGVTGSNGKTTTKELIHAVLSQRFNVLSTIGNLNNHIGVPLTLFRLDGSQDMAIIEMGASRQGDIEELCGIADPDFGLITNIGKAHLETMGGLEGVLNTKTELFAHVRRKDGFLFVHSCDHSLVEASEGTKRMTYGGLENDDVSGRVFRNGHLISVQWRRKGNADWDGCRTVPTHLTGTYNLPNLMAAVAVGIHFGLTDEEIARGISGYEPSNSRSEIRSVGSNTLILDAYNANPSSMAVALDNLMATASPRHSVILGEMLEVGPTSAVEHRSVCERLQHLPLYKVCLVGKGFKSHEADFPFHFFDDVETLTAWLADQDFHEETVLIKGSRGNRLEKSGQRLVQKLG